MTKKKVMVIGAGAGQVPIIECCKAHGLETFVVSPDGPYPGISLADVHIKEDIYNVNSLIEIGKKEKIDFVISDQSDYAVPIVAEIAEALRLPGNSPEVAKTYSYKSKFRKFCEENHIPTPKAFSVSKNYDINEFKNLKFPVIVKPSDSQGSRGIMKVNSFDSLKDAIESAMPYSKNKEVVIEEYFKGREIVCEGFILNGKYHNIAFGDREYFDIKDKFIPSKTIFPSSISENYKQLIIENENKITELLKPNFGIVHSEYLIDDSGNFIVVESALRGGGVYIASHLIPFTTGIDLTEALLNAVTGNTDKALELIESKKETGIAEYFCFYLKEGKITKISLEESLKNNPDIKLVELDNIKVGDNVFKFEHKGQRKGPILIYSKDWEDLKSAETLIRKYLVVEIDNKDGIIWS